jgi:hypothetical protein
MSKLIYKCRKKSAFIKEVITNYLSEERTLDIYTAKSEVFSYEIHNSTENRYV